MNSDILHIKRQNNSNFLIISILFFIYPILALPFILKEVKNNAKYAYFYLSIFMGYVGMLYPPIGDYYRYVQDFNIYSTLSFSELCIFFAIKTDFLMPVVFWVLGKVGFSPDFTRFLYNFIGYYLLFSIFRSITWNDSNNNRRFFLFLLLMLYVSFRLFLTRFGLSTVIFMYGVYNVFYDRKQGWMFLLLSAFHHFSFIVPIGMVVVARSLNFEGNKKLTLILLFISLVFVSDIISPILNMISSKSVIVEHIFYYVDGYYASEYYEDHSFKFRLMTLFNRMAYFIPLVYFYFNFQKSKFAGFINCLMLLLVVVAPFKGITGRFEGVTQMVLLFYVIEHFYSEKVAYSKIFRKILLFVGLFICFVNIWGSRRELSLSQESNLLLPTYCIIKSEFSDTWLDRNVNDDGSPVIDF